MLLKVLKGHVSSCVFGELSEKVNFLSLVSVHYLVCPYLILNMYL